MQLSAPGKDAGEGLLCGVYLGSALPMNTVMGVGGKLEALRDPLSPFLKLCAKEQLDIGFDTALMFLSRGFSTS